MNGIWREEVEVTKTVKEVVRLYPGARVQSGSTTWGVFWSLGRMWIASITDGWLNDTPLDYGEMAEFQDDALILANGNQTADKRYLLYTITKTVTTTETRETLVGAGSVFETADGRRWLLIRHDCHGSKWTFVTENGVAFDHHYSIEQILELGKSFELHLVEAKGVSQ